MKASTDDSKNIHKENPKKDYNFKFDLCFSPRASSENRKDKTI